jgi:hypothetical protein
MRSPRKTFHLIVWTDGSYDYYEPIRYKEIIGSPAISADISSHKVVRKAYKYDHGFCVVVNGGVR